MDYRKKYGKIKRVFLIYMTSENTEGRGRMDRKELRKMRNGKKTAAGNVAQELGELKKLQESRQGNGILTISVTCSEFLTIFCC